jgi:hypothetical protein
MFVWVGCGLDSDGPDVSTTDSLVGAGTVVDSQPVALLVTMMLLMFPRLMS